MKKAFLLSIFTFSLHAFADVYEITELTYKMSDDIKYSIKIDKLRDNPDDNMAYIESHINVEDEENMFLETEIDLSSCRVTDQSLTCVFAAEVLYLECGPNPWECSLPVKKGEMQFELNLVFDLTKPESEFWQSCLATTVDSAGNTNTVRAVGNDCETNFRFKKTNVIESN